MPKIAFIGAGSTVFTRNLVGDVLSLPELRDSTTFSLMDIDPDRLRTSEIVAGKLAAANGAGRGWKRRSTAATPCRTPTTSSRRSRSAG
jgi:alpha-galactosidase/6-phospho-beta-glucosidase family protein